MEANALGVKALLDGERQVLDSTGEALDFSVIEELCFQLKRAPSRPSEIDCIFYGTEDEFESFKSKIQSMSDPATPIMRAKVEVREVKTHGDIQEDLVMYPVAKREAYPEDGSDEDNTFAKFTPSGEIRLSIMNPALIGRFKTGDRLYVDFTAAD